MSKDHVFEFGDPIHRAWCVGYGSTYHRRHEKRNVDREYGADVRHREHEVIWIDWDERKTNGDLYVSKGGVLVHQCPAVEWTIEEEMLRIFDKPAYDRLIARRNEPPKPPTRRLPRLKGAFTDQLKSGDLFAEIESDVGVHYVLNRTAKNLTFRGATDEEIAAAVEIHVPTVDEWSDVYAARPGALYVDAWDNNPIWHTRSAEEILAMGPIPVNVRLIMRTYVRA